MNDYTAEEVFGSLENYLIYLIEEKQRMQNILNLKYNWDDKEHYAYRVEELNEKIKEVKKEICAKKNL